MKAKKIIHIIIILTAIQLIRICLNKLVFTYMTKTILLNTLFSTIYAIIITIIILSISNNKKLDILPKKFNKTYIILTVIVSLLFILTPFITNNINLISILSLIYNAIVTVIYEEILFRGYIWKEISSNNTISYIISSILFGLWHIGYIDTVIYRTSIFNPTANIFNIMLWKTITGLILGLVFGIIRYKTKNTYSSILLHTLINTIGT